MLGRLVEAAGTAGDITEQKTLLQVIKSICDTYYICFGIGVAQIRDEYGKVSLDAQQLWNFTGGRLLSLKECVRRYKYYHRFAEANNKYMKYHNPKKESSFIQYLDANNRWTMSKPLPTGNFKWMDPHEFGNLRRIINTKRKGCHPEVDLKYPTELYDLHNDLSLAPERLDMGKVKILVPNLRDKKNVYKGVMFDGSPRLKDYFKVNTYTRTKATTNFEKVFFKLISNTEF